MIRWKEELELIDNLGLLYPKVPGWWVYNKNWNFKHKSMWVCHLCVYHLNQRIPQLEEFIKEHAYLYWAWYKDWMWYK